MVATGCPENKESTSRLVKAQCSELKLRLLFFSAIKMFIFLAPTL